MELTVVTADKHPNFVNTVHNKLAGAFPEFMNHSRVVNKYWRQLYDLFLSYQFGMIDSSGEAIVLANSFPLAWDGPLERLPDGGIEWALATAVEQANNRQQPNILCAFQIVVADKARGQGLSYRAVQQMIAAVREHNLGHLIAPVRPTRKSEYPELSIDEYLTRTTETGEIFDDWLRVHLRLGGRITGVCRTSFQVAGSVNEWQEWTGMVFRASGSYAVAGGLVPVTIDLEADLGSYTEPNVWVVHTA